MKKQELVIHCLGASNTRSSICGKDGDRFLYTQEVNYPALLQQKLGCTVRNYGVGGANIARQVGRQDSYVERYPLMEEGANVVLVQGTGNDVALGVPLGTLSDTVDTTYYGALNTLVDGLYAKYTRAFILLITGMTREKDRERYEQYTAAMLEVARLKRTAFGNVRLGMLAPGKWRELTSDEVRKLLNSVKKETGVKE